MNTFKESRFAFTLPAQGVNSRAKIMSAARTIICGIQDDAARNKAEEAYNYAYQSPSAEISARVATLTNGSSQSVTGVVLKEISAALNLVHETTRDVGLTPESRTRLVRYGGSSGLLLAARR